MRLPELVLALARDGALQRVRREVDPRFELAAVVRAAAGRPLLFERVRGHAMPVVSNLCTSRALIARALGCAPGELLSRLTRALDDLQTPPVEPAGDAYQELPVDLGALPILTHYPTDGGPYLASGVAVAVDPEHGRNTSFHRAMVLGPDRLALRLVERHLHLYRARGLERFAFCVGNPVPVLLAAATSLPLGVDELGMAHALSPTPLIALAGQAVPRAELVMLCEFTGRLVHEGPFVDLTETPDIVRYQPEVRVTRLFVRRPAAGEGPALFHALLPGDLEHKLLMGMPREPTIFREVAREIECLDVRLTPGGCSWLHAAVRIRKRRPDDGRRAIEAAFRGHRSLKHVFVVDEDIELDDPAQLEWALATRFQGHRGLVVKEGEPGSSLDPSADLETNRTTKLGFDLTLPDLARAHEFQRVPTPVEVRLGDYGIRP
jgi:UbiD family decarboxylase